MKKWMSFLALSCALTLWAQEAEPENAGESAVVESPVVESGAPAEGVSSAEGEQSP